MEEFCVTAVGIGRVGDEVNSPVSRGEALSALNLEGLGRIIRMRSAPSAHNVVHGLRRLMIIMSWLVAVGLVQGRVGCFGADL